MKLIQSLTTKKFMRIDILAVILFLLGIIILLVTPEIKLDAVQNPWIALKADDGNIYILDQDRGRILVTGSDGRVIYHVENKFSYIDDMTVDNDGKIYIIDTSWKENSFMVNRDTLFMCEPWSGKVTELYHKDYKHATKHQMFGVKIISSKVHFACADSEGVTHVILNKDGTEECNFSFIYKEAVTMLQDICINSHGNKLYAIDKRGEIVCFNELSGDVHTLCRWDNINGEHYVELYRIDISEDEVIYGTEIVNNSLVEIKDNNIRIIYSGGEGTFNISVTKNGIGLITKGSFVIVDTEGKIINSADSISWPLVMKLQNTARILTLIIFILAAVYLSLRLFFVVLFKKVTTAQLISRVVIISVAIVGGVIVYQLIGSFYGLLRNEKLGKLEIIAHNISQMITEEDLNGVRKPSDFMNQSFVNMEKAMERTIDYEYDDSMYGNIVRRNDKTGAVYDVAFRDNSIGAYYPLFGSEAEEVTRIYETAETIRSSISTENGGFSYVKVPILGASGEVAGVVEVGTWTDVIVNQVNSIIKNILLQLAVWLIMILFIFNEIFEFMNLREREANMNIPAEEMSLHMNRLLIFLVFLSYNLPTAFLPVYVANHYMKTGAAANGLAMSLPISVNMALLGGIGLIGYALVKRFSFTRSMAGGAVLTMAGDIILATAPGYAYIFLGLVLNGVGAGLQMNLVHSINSHIADKKNDSTIYTIYQSGSLSGIMVGMTLGAILADILGQGNVFFVTAALWFIIASVMFFAVRNVKLDVGAKDTRRDNIGLMKFIFSRRVLAFLICVLFFYVMISSFVYYYVPIYNDQLGNGSNMSCLLIILFSLCGIYLSGSITKFMIQKCGKNAIYISSAVSLGALMFFAFFQTLGVIIVTIFLLGFSTSFGSGVRFAAFSELPQTKEYGVAATGIYDLVEMIGGAVGPIVFASMFAGNFLTGMMIFIGLSVASLVFYFALNQFEAIFSGKAFSRP